MAKQTATNNVWTAMEYKPPRGRCNYKGSFLSSCPCLRFMLHPVKAATSFECDGCAHHASFHSLENVQEDAILKKWSEQGNKDATGGATKKRRRTAGKSVEVLEILELADDNGISSSAHLLASKSVT